jgi:hypothetical protein
MKTKDQLRIKLVEIEELKDEGRSVKYIRLDDARENASIERACKEKNLDIQFEFSGPRIAQRNWKVEGKSLNLYGCVRSMLNDTGIKEEIRRSI